MSAVHDDHDDSAILLQYWCTRSRPVAMRKPQPALRARHHTLLAAGQLE